MIKNYLKVAWRNLLKHRGFTLINIAGLATGLACFILIALYVVDELSFDRFNDKAERIYRINSDIIFGGTPLHMSVSPDIMGETLKKDYPEVEQYTRIYNSNGSKLIRKGKEFLSEGDVAHVDSTFFDVFTFPAIEGDPKTALNEPNTVVLTESAARKYFGTTHVLGKTLETNDNGTTLYKVTAVIRDMPHNAQFHFDFLFSMDNVDYGWGNYLSHNFHTYLLLQKDADYHALEQKFPEYINKYVLPQAQSFMQVKSMADFEKAGNKLVYSLIPLTRVHLYSDWNLELSPGGSIQYVYIFSAVAFFILLIACINFMNLTTARSAGRAREVGIRKVLGTERKNLVFQFLTESTLMVFISLLLAIGIAALVLPMFNNVAAKSISLQSLTSPLILPLLLLLPIVVGLLAGSYPAFYLSAFRPIMVLKGIFGSGHRNATLRSVLVVLQFSISVILIAGTIIIYRQLHYIQTKNLGFDKDQVLIINGAFALGNQTQAFKNEMLQLRGVERGTFSGYLPVSSSSRSDNTFSKEAVMDAQTGFNMQIWRIDYDYIPTMGMEIKQGRNFSPEFRSDSSGVIINETAANVLGYDDPIGKTLYGYPFDSNLNELIPLTIVGVVKNFHFESLRHRIGPLCFFLGNSTGLASFKVHAADIPSILKQAEQKWKTMAPGMPFSYRFLNDSFDDMYRAEQRVGKVALMFAVLAILIACLGLFGLTTFIAEQRTKEIGIRKVLGASVPGLVQLLSRDFLKLVLFSFLIGIPLAWYFMYLWLQDFAYRIPISWWIFGLAGLIALAIALATVSFQAIKAAIANPVRSLRTE